MEKKMEMQSEVHVNKAFPNIINGKNFFVLQCKIINGAVRSGMNMCLPFSSGLDITIPIDELRVVTDEFVEVIVYCEDSEEINFLSELNLVGLTLLVE